MGYISDEKNDAFYWFVRENYEETSSISEPRDIIFQYKNNTVTHVFVDKKQPRISVSSLSTPSSGIINISSLDGINALSVGDKLVNWTLNEISLGNDFVYVQSIDVANLQINVGDYTNVNWANIQDHGINFQIERDHVLDFPENTITGINIVDDMLFWTDNKSEPKVINIIRSILNTNQNGQQHTSFTNPETNQTVPIREEHVTVIKKSPKNTIDVEYGTTDAFAYGDTNPISMASGTTTVLYTPGDIIEITFDYDALSPSNYNIEKGDTILLNNKYDIQGNLANLPPGTYQLSVKVEDISSATSSSITCDVSIISINSQTQLSTEVYNWSVQSPAIKKFKNKFPRFSYRYRYIDGEYSTYAPFTRVIFEPGDFKYDIKEAFNKGMENKISKITLKNYNNLTPLGVVAIDLLYKESNSPLVYIIDTVNFNNYWDDTIGYEVKPDQIKAVLPENQLLRTYDNVPRKALAQDVSGSRLIYGNYLQNYNEENFRIKVNTVDRETCDPTSYLSSSLNPPKKSLKSIRNYTLGISYLDTYGRQTPVFTNKLAEIEVPINESSSRTQLTAQPFGDFPDWATHYKVFVKESSNEYYNLAMDRIYDARDGNIWLSFPSSDRNKVDEETFLILKKISDTSVPVKEDNRYKILAIENEAPEWIKTKYNFVAESNENPASTLSSPLPPTHLFDQAGYRPVKGSQRIDIDVSEWDSNEIPIDDIELPAAIRLQRRLPSGVIEVTQMYDIMSVDRIGVTPTNLNGTEYAFKLHKPIEEEWLETSIGSGAMVDSLVMRIFRKIKRNSPIFDGRFFVKIKRDSLINETVLHKATLSQQKQLVGTTTIPFYYFADGANPNNNDNTTGNAESNTSTHWNTLLDPNTQGSLESFWIIDSAYSDGYYDQGGDSWINAGMWRPVAVGMGNWCGSTSNLIDIYPNYNNTGWNKGIYSEASGNTTRYYIDLSFVGLMPARHYGTGATQSLHREGTGNLSFVQLCADRLFDDHDCFSTDNDLGCMADEIFWAKGSNPTTNGNHLSNWRVGSNENDEHVEWLPQVQKLVNGSKFRFMGDPDTVYTIINDPQSEQTYHVNHYNADNVEDKMYCGGSSGCYYHAHANGQTSASYSTLSSLFDRMHKLGHKNNRRVTFKIEVGDEFGDPIDPTTQTFNPLSQSNLPGALANATNQGGIQFVELDWVIPEDQIVPEDPTIWETEPKEDIDLDIYYETDGTFPLTINNDTNYHFAPKGSIPMPYTMGPTTFLNVNNASVINWEENTVELSDAIQFNYYTTSEVEGAIIEFKRPDGSCVSGKISGFDENNLINLNLTYPTFAAGAFFATKITLDPDIGKNKVSLSWFNCYSFENGVESNRIRDDFNQVIIDKGAKASSTINELYEEEHRKYGLIYSGLYNSTSGVNNLNQFIQAEKITKDVNPIYGSIQKLHARDTDLIALCEDKILKILSNKDAVFNADNNPQLTATDKVLGQTIPFVGEFGISNNPESFASESYRAYFTDKVRGSVMRLSMDGLTPISMHGMKDWFKDNLKLNNTLFGSYDDKKNEYNLILPNTNDPTLDGGTTVSFREDVKGWVSFKSFVPENAISCANDYYTFVKGKLWKHHNENVDRNTFYGDFKESIVTTILNKVPGSVKSFTTLNYEGTQSKVDQFTVDASTGLTDGEYYNLIAKKGWYVDSIFTDLEKGSVNEFIEKEGKWFNYIKGENVQFTDDSHILINDDGSSSFDQASFAIQGLGILNITPVEVGIGGCTDSTAFNYNPQATFNDGTCTPTLMGCLESTAVNYNPSLNTDDGSCAWAGCTCNSSLYPNGCTNTSWFVNDPTVITYINNNQQFGASMVDDGTCVATIYGCTDNSKFNYNSSANTPCDSGCIGGQTGPNCCCEPFIYGCMIPSASNTNLTANTDDGTCTWYGCTNPLAPNHGYENPLGGPNLPWTSSILNYAASGSQYGVQDDGSCLGGGCTDPIATNYNISALWDDGSCAYCNTWNFNVVTNVVNTTGAAYNNGSVEVYPDTGADDTPYIFTITNSSGSSNFSSIAGSVPNSTSFYDLPADTYTINIITNNGCTSSVQITIINSVPSIYGCMDPTACNYDPLANVTTGVSCQWTTCAGCTDSTAISPAPGAVGAYNTQTNTDTNCLLGYTFNPGACTLDCNGQPIGTNNSGWNACCTYPAVLGCTNSTAFNYNSLATVDDGSCCYVSGCTDPLATNYDPTACHSNPSSCTYPAVVSGCADPNACNYSPGATHDCTGSILVGNLPTNSPAFSTSATGYGCCVFGFSNVSVGDPEITDGQGNPVQSPVFYDDNSGTGQTIKHFMFNTPTTNPYLQGQPPGPNNPTAAALASIYPADTPNESDVGLSFTADNIGMDQYNSSNGDTIVVNLRKYDNSTSSWTIVDTKIYGGQNQSPFVTGQQGIGNRITSPPYTFGANFNDPSNYEFNIFEDPTNTLSPKQQYMIEIYSVINGTNYGELNGLAANAACGVSQIFDFTTLSPCDHPGAITGCTDPNNCAYNAQATCHDPSMCLPVGTNNCWECVTATPQQGGGSSCQVNPCSAQGWSTCDFPSENGSWGGLASIPGGCTTTQMIIPAPGATAILNPCYAGYTGPATYNCDASTGACSSPGNGTGNFTSYTACTTFCGQSIGGGI